jgi:hypothetical protein
MMMFVSLLDLQSMNVSGNVCETILLIQIIHVNCQPLRSKGLYQKKWRKRTS